MTNKTSKSQTPPLSTIISTLGVGNSPGPSANGELSTPPAQIFLSAYSPKRKISITFPTEGRTKQSFKAECDINTIMARYMKTGLLEHVRADVAQYLDVTGADYQDAQNLVAGAKSMFHSLPSHIRSKFENDPAQLLAFMENPANAAEAVKLGLQTAQAESSNPPTGAVAPTPPAASTQAAAASGPGGDTPPKPTASKTI